MRSMTRDQLTALLKPQDPPCVSLYQPTHRRFHDSRQDPIRYRNLLRDVENSLRLKYPERQTRPLLDRFQALADDRAFWQFRTEGLAVFGSPTGFQFLELQRPTRELVVVADSYHVKPVLRTVQSADRFQVLALTRQRFRLFEGNRDTLDAVDLTGTPSTIEEVLGDQLTEPHQTVASYGGGSGSPHAPQGEPAMYHGHGSRKDEVETDTTRFFRAVDRAVLGQYSRPSGLPLVLAALTEHHAPFRAVSHNPFLLPLGLRGNPEVLDRDQLRHLAWQVLLPHYLDRLAQRVDSFRVAQSRQAGSDDLQQVARAAVEGRVGTLLVEADRVIPGRVDPVTGKVEPGDLAHPELDDVLDDLAEMVLKRDGEVIVVPGERMPSRTGLAAAYRF